MRRWLIKLAWVAAVAIIVGSAPNSLCLAAVEEPAAEAGIVTPLDQWSCVFAGHGATFRYACGDATSQITHAEWELTIGDRVISRGNGRTKQLADETIGDHVEISLELPPVKPGVVVTAELDVTLHTQRARFGTHQRQLFIFPADPFADRQQWLRKLNILLFDPAGTTAKVFEKHGIPAALQPTLAAIDEAPTGLLIIGEGLRWKDQPGLVATARRAARRGVPVLCLAPTEGEMPVASQSSTDPPELKQLLVAREDVTRRFDKRFDTRHWLGGPSAVSRFELLAKEHVLAAQVLDSPAAWPWIELHFADPPDTGKNVTLIVCGMGIIKYWNDGPVPRYLLSAILESLQNSPPSIEEGITDATQ